MMRPEDIRAWRNTNLALDLLGKVWRFSRERWVVSIPVATWIIAGLMMPNDFLALLTVAAVTYFTVKKWRERKSSVAANHAENVEALGGPEAYARAQWYNRSWPEVARHAGLCQRKDSYGLGTWGAAKEGLRTITPTARLDALRKGSPLDDLDVPAIVSIRRSPLGVALDVQMLPGQDLRTYEKAAESIAHQWTVEQVRIALAAPGVVTITPVTENPLGPVYEITPTTVPVMESLKSVQVGLQEDGRPWAFPLDQNHAVVGGVPGSGKSVTLNVILAGVSQRPDIQIVGIDCAGGVELSDWSPRFAAFATNQFEAIDALEALWAEHERRIEWLKANGYKSVANAGYSQEMPLYLVVIDEAAQLFRIESMIKEEKDRGKQLMDLVTRLVTVSRKTGIVVVLATQKPTTNTIPSLIRDNAQVKVCFRVTTPEAATAVLGDSASLAPLPPTAIKRKDKGVAIAESVDGDLTVVRSFYINEDSDRAIAKAYAHLARPLPRQVDDDIVDAEVIG